MLAPLIGGFRLKRCEHLGNNHLRDVPMVLIDSPRLFERIKLVSETRTRKCVTMEIVSCNHLNNRMNRTHLWPFSLLCMLASLCHACLGLIYLP